MTASKASKAPGKFIRLLDEAMKQHPDMSLREVARQADISPAYLSRLLSGERGVPSNDAISQLEKVLTIPHGELFEAAGRPNNQALEFFRKDEAGPIMGMLANVPISQLPAVRELIEKFVKKQGGDKK